MSASPSVTLRQKSGYQFEIEFDPAMPSVLADEPAPLGEGAGPAPTHLLLAGVANCLAASLYFALAKFKQDSGGITATATCRIDRNEHSRLRVTEIAVRLDLGAAGEQIEHLERVLSQFEDFCTVSQSVRAGVPIAVSVADASGRLLKGG